MKLFSAMGIDHDVGIAQIRVLANFRVLRVVLSAEEDVQLIMRRKAIEERKSLSPKDRKKAIQWPESRGAMAYSKCWRKLSAPR